MNPNLTPWQETIYFRKDQNRDCSPHLTLPHSKASESVRNVLQIYRLWPQCGLSDSEGLYLHILKEPTTPMLVIPKHTSC